MLKALASSLVLALLVSCQNTAPHLSSRLPAGASLQQQSSALADTVSSPHGGTLSGQFQLHSQVSSQFLKQKRDVLVWLPPDYDAQQSRRYPVLYMHDGNNVFDRRSSFGGQEWEVDERAGQLIRQGTIAPVIIVGIYNTADRMQEYTWYPDRLDGSLQGGQGAQYARFVAEELKPLIDKSYRTLPDRKHTSVIGSSLGGLISFYIGAQYPQVFGQVGMMSPSIWWKDRAILRDIPKLPNSTRIWVDMGTQEGNEPEVTLQDAKDFVKGLEQAGFKHFDNLAFHIEPGGNHSEQSWAQRIEQPLRFFFSP